MIELRFLHAYAIMTYPAPRQGLFAIIILISLTLNLLFFVINAQKQLSTRFESTARKEAILLAEELAAPLSINDRISISVLANRYIQADDLAFIGVYDINENLLVPVGKESTGFIAKEVVANKSNVLGYVMVQAHETNRAHIISQNWIYLTAVAFLHAILWLLYGYLARPSNELRLSIAHDVRNRLLAKGLLHEVSHRPDDKPNTTTNTPNIKQPIATPDVSGHGKKEVNPNQFVVQIRFEDPNRLLDTVSQQTKNAYFSLCHRLILNATKELLSQSQFAQINLEHMSEFSDDGCRIVLSGQGKNHQTALSAIMLSHLILLLSQTIYAKHRELKRFALNMRTYVSDTAHQKDIISVGAKHRKTPLVLLPPQIIVALSSHGSFIRLPNPMSVAERECRHARHLGVSYVETIEQLRDKVLLSD